MILKAWNGTSTANPPARPTRFSRRIVSFFFSYIHSCGRVAALLLLSFILSSCESALVRQVSYYESVEDFKSAREYLEDELNRRPENTEARYLLGRVLFANNQFQQGRQVFDEVEQQTARYHESIAYLIESTYRKEFQRGIESQNDGEVEDAVLRFQNASHIRPESVDAHRVLAHALVRADRIEEARDAYQTAIDLSPDDLESLNNLAEIEFRLERYAESLTVGLQVLELDPAHEIARRRIAHTYLNLDRPAEAAESFKQLLADANDARDLRDYAVVLYNLERFEESVPYLEQLAGAANPELDILRTLSEACLGLERYNQVVTTSEIILERSPEDRKAMANLIAAYERLGLFDKARDWQSRLTRLGGEM